MADYSVEISLSDHKRGDKWIGITSIGPVTINAVQPAATLAKVRMCFEYKAYKYSLDSDSGTISIDNATTWEVSIPEVQDFLQYSGDWTWDMEFYETGDTSPLTLYKGTLTVHDDVC